MDKLYKTKDCKILAGVCAGIAEYCSIDISLVRIITIIASLAFPLVIVGYITAAIILPEKKSIILDSKDIGHAQEVCDISIEDIKNTECSGNIGQDNQDSNIPPDSTDGTPVNNKNDSNTGSDKPPSKRRLYVGGIITGIGIVALLQNLFYWFDFQVVVSIFIILVGALIIFSNGRSHV